MKHYICSLFPSVRKINVSTLTLEGALGIDNGKYEAFHLEVTGSALPHVGHRHQYLPSAPPQPSTQCKMGWSSSGCWGQMSGSQQTLWAALLGNGMDPLSSAPDVTAAPAFGSAWAPPGNLTFCCTCTTHEWWTCYSCPVQNNPFKKQDTPERKSVCYKVGTSITEHKKGASAASRLWKSSLKWRSILHLTKYIMTDQTAST